MTHDPTPAEILALAAACRAAGHPLVLTDGKVGLTDGDADRATALLTVEPGKGCRL